jgi:nucleotide-binding universal stress UspA family protein
VYEKLLVPLDGSEMGEMAVPYALEVAAGAGAELTLVSVSESHAGETDRLYQTYLQSVEALVLGQLPSWGVGKRFTVRTVVSSGSPAEDLTGYAEQNDVSLIVMASRGRSGAGQWPLGHIAARVLRAAHNPVLLVRKPPDDVSVKQRRLIRKILLPLDGSPMGEAAVSNAAGMASLLGAELVLLHVLEPDFTPGVSEGIAAPWPIPKERVEHRKGRAEDYLNWLAGKLREGALTVSTAVASGRAADEIVEYAGSHAIDLVAMATHGKSGIGRWVFGSVTDKVLHAGDMPVLMVPPVSAAGV